MEILQTVLLTLSIALTVILTTASAVLWFLRRKITKALLDEMPDVNKKIEMLIKNKDGAFEDFKKDEMAASILGLSSNIIYLRTLMYAMMSSIISTYIYFM